MAKKQTRRSISLSRVTYEQLHAVAERHGVSLSQFTEAALRHFMAIPNLMASAFKDHPPAPVKPKPRSCGLVPKPTAPLPSQTARPVVSPLREALDRGLGKPPLLDLDAPIVWCCPQHHTVDCERCDRPTCALCVEVIKRKAPIFRRPFGRNDAPVLVCERCDTEHPNSGGYSIGAGPGRGIGEGNKRSGAHS